MSDGLSNARDPRDDFWFMPIGGGSASGVRVTADTAMAIAAFYSGVRLIAETEAQLPLVVYRRDASGDKQRAANHPIHDLLHDQPNDEHTAIEFREIMTAYAVTRGTAIAEIVPGRRGSVDQLIPIHPDHIYPVRVMDVSGRRQWQLEVKEPGAPARRLLRSDVFILRAMATNADCPMFGLDPITVQAGTLGSSIAANDYAQRFFRNDARPSIAIQHPSYFKDQTSRENWIAAFIRKFTGEGRHKPLLLEWGMDIKTISVTPEQAQFLETRKLQAEDIARMLRIQPHKLGIMDNATFSNIEHQSIEFVQDTMMPWLVRWEQAIKRDLILRPGYFAEHNVAGLLRGDLKARYDAYAVGRQWGWLSVNEIRRMENMNSLGEEGDIYLQPMNMVEPGEDPEPAPEPEPPSDPEGEPDPPDDDDASAVNGRRHFLMHGQEHTL